MIPSESIIVISTIIEIFIIIIIGVVSLVQMIDLPSGKRSRFDRETIPKSKKRN